jgi:hypothetical protein
MEEIEEMDESLKEYFSDQFSRAIDYLTEYPLLLPINGRGDFYA